MTAYTTAPVLDIKHTLLGDAEQTAVAQVLVSADLSGNAAAVTTYEDALAEWFATAHAVACSSGTSAVHLALLALGIGAADEVMVAATAPVMTALPVLAVGATPVFVDVAHPRTFALDAEDVERKLTPRTRVVIAVPMWGYPADDRVLARTCTEHGLALIEDAAQAHGTVTDGRLAGTGVTIGTFSTHARKIMTTGEGGFCLTDDDDLDEHLRQLRNLGRHPGGGPFGARFGLNVKLPALTAALGTVQLQRLRSRIQHRLRTLQALTVLAREVPGLVPFPVPERSAPNGYAALFTTSNAQYLAGQLAEVGITSDPLRYGYRPVYHSPVLREHAPSAPCRNAEHLTRTLVTLPCHEGIGWQEIDRIALALSR